MIQLDDRIKELSHSTGTGIFRLDGAATGFSAFSSKYAYDDYVFYAISDGTNYEVGSGQYIQNGGNNSLRRYPFKSTNSNSLVDFGAGVKEVFVTYPGRYAVFSASGVSSFDKPQSSGVAFWGSDQILDYDNDLTWDKQQSRLGIRKQSPNYAIDVGGASSYSLVRSSGFIVGNSGIAFSGGVQTHPFTPNKLNVVTGTDAVFMYSGSVSETLTFKKQNAGLVLAGPPSGCTPPSTCSPDYPSFRPLVDDDIPDLSSLYLKTNSNGGTLTSVSGFLAIPTYADFTSGSGVIGQASANNQGVMFYDLNQNRLYISTGSSWKYSSFT